MAGYQFSIAVLLEMWRRDVWYGTADVSNDGTIYCFWIGMKRLLPLSPGHGVTN